MSHAVSKIAVAGVVGLLIATRVMWVNRGRIPVGVAVIVVTVITAMSMGIGAILVTAESVRSRMRAGEKVSFVSRLVFGSGIWSLLLWIIGIIVVGFPVAIVIGSLTADRPAG